MINWLKTQNWITFSKRSNLECGLRLNFIEIENLKAIVYGFIKLGHEMAYSLTVEPIKIKIKE